MAEVEAIMESSRDYRVLELERQVVRSMRELHPGTAHLLATAGQKYGSFTTLLVAWRGKQGEPELTDRLLQGLAPEEQRHFFKYGKMLPQGNSWEDLARQFPLTASSGSTKPCWDGPVHYLHLLWEKATTAITAAPEPYLERTAAFYGSLKDHSLKERKNQTGDDRTLERAYAQSKDPLVRTLLLEQYQPWIGHAIGKINKRIPSWILNYQEMVQIATAAFLEVLDRYDPEQEVKLTTFSEKRIQGAIWDYLREQDPLPKDVRRLIRKMEHIRESSAHQFQGEPSSAELAQRLGQTEEKVEELLLLREMTYKVSLERPARERSTRDGTAAISFMDSPFASTHFAVQRALEENWSPEEQRLRMLDAERIHQAIQDLPCRERVIMELYYQKEYSMTEIAKLLGVTSARISQIHGEVLVKVREQFRDQV